MTYPDPKQPDPYGAGSGPIDPYPQPSYPPAPYGYGQPQQFAPPQPPPANGGWAVASIIFFWPLAFIAVSRAFSVYPLWAQGRYAEAEAASASVRRLGIISLAIIAVLAVLYIAFIVVIVAVGASTADDF